MPRKTKLAPRMVCESPHHQGARWLPACYFSPRDHTNCETCYRLIKSLGTQKAWDHYYETLGSCLPDTKMCTSCKQVKCNSEFYLRKKPRRNGDVYITLASECKICIRARARAVRDSKTLEQRRANRRRWEQGRNQEKKRTYSREYSRMRRERDGIESHGPWKKYRKSSDPRLPRQPLQNWAQQNRITAQQLSLASGVDEAVFRRTTPYLSLSTIDRVAVGLGHPDLVAVLYPVEAPKFAA